MTEEQLVENGYPRPDPDNPGKVIMKLDARNSVSPDKKTVKAGDDDDDECVRRVCDRCSKTYRVDQEGVQLDEEKCVNHWGKRFRKRGNRGRIIYLS